MRLERKVEIRAARDAVWRAVADVERWPTWTSSMSEVHWLDGGTLEKGARARVKQPGMPALEWEVTDLQPATAFTWQTRSPGMTTVAVHRLEQDAPGGPIILTLELSQTGVLSPVIGMLTKRRVARFFRLEADGLKRCAETA